METPDEMLARVESMASGSETWDLSDADLDALRFLLKHLGVVTGATAMAEFHAKQMRAELAAAALTGYRTNSFATDKTIIAALAVADADALIVALEKP